MDSWKLAAIITWIILGIIIFIFVFVKKKWFSLGKDILLGQRLHTSINQLYKEIEEDKISRETLADLTKHVLWRFTRIGLFAILAALIPVSFIALQTYLLNNQNVLINDQTRLIDIQNKLIEAERRSSLVFLTSNVLDKFDQEIKDEKEEILARGAVFLPKSHKYALSTSLISRIIALSRSFKPYNILDTDNLSKKLISPERGQLLFSLLSNNLDSTTQTLIVQRGDFSNAVVGDIRLYEAKLRGAKFHGADFRGAQFTKANLSSPEPTMFDRLRNTSSEVNYKNFTTDLSSADFSGAYFFGAILKNVNLENANLTNTDLYGADLTSADLYGADLSGADLNHAKGLTPEQLIQVKSLYDTKNLDPEIRKVLETKRKCLFDPEGCQN